jgi:hypothetical protein
MNSQTFSDETKIEIERMFYENFQNVSLDYSTWSTNKCAYNSDDYIVFHGTEKLRVEADYKYVARNRKELIYRIYFYFDCLGKQGTCTPFLYIGSLSRPKMPVGFSTKLRKLLGNVTRSHCCFMKFDCDAANILADNGKSLKFDVVKDGIVYGNVSM